MDEVELMKLGVKKGVYPKMLYKYRCMGDRSDEMIWNSNIWFNNPLKFNDPYDFQIEDKGNYTQGDLKKYLQAEKVPKKTINKILKETKNNGDKVKDIIDKVKKRVFENKGVLCLSIDPKNILMWSHYSKDHTGLIFGFKIVNDLEFFITPIKVKYRKLLTKISYLTEKDKIVTHCIQRKFNHWAYEQEIRIVKNKSGLVSFDKECLSEIIFGCNSSDTDIKRIKNIVKCSDYPLVNFYKASKSKSSFKMILNKI